MNRMIGARYISEPKTTRGKRSYSPVESLDLYGRTNAQSFESLCEFIATEKTLLYSFTNAVLEEQ